MWEDLKARAEDVSARRILDLFDADETRAETFSCVAGSLHFDYSKTNIDVPTRDALLELADRADIVGRRDAMFSGEKINVTEGRAVLHTALRNLGGGQVMVDDQDVMPGVLETLERMEKFCLIARAGQYHDVVNIGIGGSDLGPAMAAEALRPYHDGPRIHFVSNVDGAHIADTLKDLDPKKTLVVVASKTFTTIETMTNAHTARQWMHDNGGDPTLQFVALSSNLSKTADFGIPPERVFGFEDWVGGRYSMWGPIGLSLMIAIGMQNFRAFLQGAQMMDIHFQSAQGAENMPLMLALVGVWHQAGAWLPDPRGSALRSAPAASARLFPTA